MNTQMQASDIAWYVLPESKADDFAVQFANIRNQQDEQEFYGEFVVNPNTTMGELAFAYGFANS